MTLPVEASTALRAAMASWQRGELSDAAASRAAWRVARTLEPDETGALSRDEALRRVRVVSDLCRLNGLRHLRGERPEDARRLLRVGLALAFAIQDADRRELCVRGLEQVASTALAPPAPV